MQENNRSDFLEYHNTLSNNLEESIINNSLSKFGCFLSLGMAVLSAIAAFKTGTQDVQHTVYATLAGTTSLGFLFISKIAYNQIVKTKHQQEIDLSNIENFEQFANSEEKNILIENNNLFSVKRKL